MNDGNPHQGTDIGFIVLEGKKVDKIDVSNSIDVQEEPIVESISIPKKKAPIEESKVNQDEAEDEYYDEEYDGEEDEP